MQNNAVASPLDQTKLRTASERLKVKVKLGLGGLIVALNPRAKPGEISGDIAIIVHGLSLHCGINAWRAARRSAASPRVFWRGSALGPQPPKPVRAPALALVTSPRGHSVTRELRLLFTVEVAAAAGYAHYVLTDRPIRLLTNSHASYSILFLVVASSGLCHPASFTRDQATASPLSLSSSTQTSKRGPSLITCRTRKVHQYRTACNGDHRRIFGSVPVSAHSSQSSQHTRSPIVRH